MNDEELIAAFHTLWDNFPGMARLIDSHHVVLAANPVATEKALSKALIVQQLAIVQSTASASMEQCFVKEKHKLITF